MRFVKRFARLVGVVELEGGESWLEYRCPNNKCSLHVSEEYQFCPYCGQRLKFRKTEKLKELVLFNQKPSKSILRGMLK